MSEFGCTLNAASSEAFEQPAIAGQRKVLVTDLRKRGHLPERLAWSTPQASLT